MTETQHTKIRMFKRRHVIDAILSLVMFISSVAFAVTAYRYSTSVRRLTDEYTKLSETMKEYTIVNQNIRQAQYSSYSVSNDREYAHQTVTLSPNDLPLTNEITKNQNDYIILNYNSQNDSLSVNISLSNPESKIGLRIGDAARPIPIDSLKHPTHILVDDSIIRYRIPFVLDNGKLNFNTVFTDFLGRDILKIVDNKLYAPKDPLTGKPYPFKFVNLRNGLEIRDSYDNVIFSIYIGQDNSIWIQGYAVADNKKYVLIMGLAEIKEISANRAPQVFKEELKDADVLPFFNFEKKLPITNWWRPK